MSDVYVVAAKRTAIGRLGGVFANTSAVDLGATVARAVLGALPEPNLVHEAIFGNVLGAGCGMNVARQIAIGERDGLERIEIRVGNVETRRDFSDVRDVVRAYRLVAERGDPAAPYLVCSGRSVAISELIDGLVALARTETVVVSDATLRRDGEQPDLYGSPDRLTADTGWVPEIPLETSLRDTLDWWRRRVAEED